MISSKTCVDMAGISSNLVNMVVVPNVMPSIFITPSIDSTICIGTEVVFTSEVENDGDLPVYEWLINGSLARNNDATFSTTTLNDGDGVACRLVSALVCLEENPVLFNEVVVSVDSCMVGINGAINAIPNVLLYPNPTDGRIFVEISDISSNFTFRLLNTNGRILLSSYEDHPSGSLVRQEINLRDLPQGIYYFQIITDDGTITTKRIVVY